MRSRASRGEPADAAPRGRRLLVLNWRDTGHPEGGGSEIYVDQVARRLAERGWDVTLFCAAYPGAPRDERRDGIRHVRRGGHLSVYPAAARLVALGGLRRHDVVLEVQNGAPFLARLFTRRPVVVLVHHVHREQWHVIGPTLARIGWLLESRVAPAVNRRSAYVTVSAATQAELAEMGIAEDRVTIAHNALPPAPDAVACEVPRSVLPRMVVLSRLVPHKQIEHAIDCLAELRPALPTLTLDVVGSGWWHERLVEHARDRGVLDAVRFHGHVSEQRKHELLARAWVHLLPSVKEGWGLSIVEAAIHGTPSVAYRSAGGVQESIQDGVTGLLALDQPDLVDLTRRLLLEESLRSSLGAKAAMWAREFGWDATATQVEDTLLAALG